VDVDCKADASPVTIADRQAEEVMRALISQAFPDHGIFGEEHGLSLGSGAGERYMWVLDPIDGTKSFITGERALGAGRWVLGCAAGRSRV
jgi:inositol-phosphate phosphatase/L-galactose 1-phosphate phosphatase/histidinol-phosphatase